MGVKRHGRVAPAEGDVRVMALSLGQIGGTLHERERLGEVLEPKRALDPVRVIETGTAKHIRHLAQVRLGLIGREGRDSAPAGEHSEGQISARSRAAGHLQSMW